MAGRVLLGHVTHGRADRLTLAQVAHLGSIPDSSNQEYCGLGTRFVEGQCGYPPSVYFYAGRACPDYGSAALGFPPECEGGRIDSITPFGTGGVVKADLGTAFRLAIDPDHLAARAAFCRASTIPGGPGWRPTFARWLAHYFPSDPKGYWTRGAGPEVADPQGLYRNPNWQAWAWEVRFRSPSVFDAECWAADSAVYHHLLERVALGTLSPNVTARLERFLSTCLTPRGDANFCAILEEEVQSRC
jgi:hypothetical protein